jgi:hypothetical protein
MESKRASGKILVAVRPADVAMMFDALGFEFEAVVCHSLKDAKLKLDDSISAVLCGLRFDGGLIFELLRHAKTTPATSAISFYSVVECNNIFSPAILISIQLAGKALGANGSINLFDVTNSDGEPTAHDKLRQTVRQIVNGT